MPQHTFLTVPVGRRVGLTSVSVGLVRTLDRLGIPSGFFKALGQPHPGETFDRSSAYLEATTLLRPPTPIDTETVQNAVTQDAMDDLMEQVVSRFENLPAEQEAVIVEGLVPTSDLPHAHRLNVAMRRALDAEVLLVTRPEASNTEAIRRQLKELFDLIPPGLFDRTPGVIFNHLDLAELSADLGVNSIEPGKLLAALRPRLGPGSDRFDIVGLVPFRAELGHTRIADALDELHGSIVVPGNMERRIKKITLCARTVANSIRGFSSGTLVVTPADRTDIIVGAALAASKSIQLAGLVLTGDTQPDESLLDYCKDSFSLDGGTPILRVPTSSFEISRALHELNPEIPVQDVERINQAMDTVARHTESTWITRRCASYVEKRLSPPAFRHRISKIARNSLKRIILPEGEEPRTVEAAVRCGERAIAECLLIGNPQQIREIAHNNDLEIPPLVRIIDPEPIRDRYLGPLMELRKHKGLTEANAIEALSDNVTLGTMMLARNEVDGLVSGAIHSTASTIRPALQLIRTAPNAKVVSSVFFMCLPEEVLVYGDCAVNPDPDAETPCGHRHPECRLGQGLRHRTHRRHDQLLDPRLGIRLRCRESTRGNRDRTQAESRTRHRWSAAVRRRQQPGGRGHQGARQQGRWTGECLHLPRPEHRKHNLQGGPAIGRGGVHGPHAPGHAETGQRPQPRCLCRGHPLHHRAHLGAGPGFPFVRDCQRRSRMLRKRRNQKTAPPRTRTSMMALGRSTGTRMAVVTTSTRIKSTTIPMIMPPFTLEATHAPSGAPTATTGTATAQYSQTTPISDGSSRRKAKPTAEVTPMIRTEVGTAMRSSSP